MPKNYNYEVVVIGSGPAEEPSKTIRAYPTLTNMRLTTGLATCQRWQQRKLDEEERSALTRGVEKGIDNT
jgi:hypothetical protein